MLQFSTICAITGRLKPRLYWRFTALLTTNSAQPLENESVKIANKTYKWSTSDSVMSKEQNIRFNELKMTISKSISAKPSIIFKIQNSRNVHELLSFIKMPYLSQGEILTIMKTIVSWIDKNKKSMLPDETKKQIINETVEIKKQLKNETVEAKKELTHESVSTKKNLINEPVETKKNLINEEPKIKNIEEVKPVERTYKFEDRVEEAEFAKYLDLSTSAMIQEISNLRTAKSRDVKLLRFLYDNILQYNDTLNAGECSNLLFSMCVLNYPHKELLDKMSVDMANTVIDLTQASIISIIKSMAILKYKNVSFLNHVSDLIANSKNPVNQKFILSILLSFAMLGHECENIKKIIENYVPRMTQDGIGIDNWLNTVWSLAILNSVQTSQLQTVLNNEFSKKIMSTNPKTTIPKQLKLLNINGVAKHLLQNYQGPILDNSIVPSIVAPSMKGNKYVTALEETLQSLISENSYEMNVNTGMGFALDAECCVDHNFQPIRRDNELEQKNTKKTAVMLFDYHSYCLGSTELHGQSKLYERLIKASGYRLLSLSYRQFGVEDKLAKRADVLKRRIQFAQ